MPPFAMTMARVKDEAKAGQGTGAMSSLLKYYGTELNKQRQELLMSILGTDGLIWEGGQLLLSGSEIWDSVLDWVAVSCGAALCAAIWLHRRGVAAAVAGALLLILSIGAGKRR